MLYQQKRAVNVIVENGNILVTNYLIDPTKYWDDIHLSKVLEP